MFNRLQKKWKVNGLQLALVLCTFAIGGSLTGYAGRRLMGLLDIGPSWLWIVVYIVLITLLWPMAVLLVSIPFGQFRFFINYLRKIGRRVGVGRRESGVGDRKSEPDSYRVGSGKPDDGQRMMDGSPGSGNGNAYLQSPTTGHPTSNIEHQTSDRQNIAIFASGEGSNAQKIIDHFRNSATVSVGLIVCNKPGAGVLQVAAREQIPTLLIEKEPFFRGDAYLDELKARNIRFIVLAGFLWKIPVPLIAAYPGRIINIHPALLPAYGGKGMYGSRVHEAVIAAGETESGISIHYVDEIYDHGRIILQEKCAVLPGDTPDSLALRVHALEHAHYPALIEQLLTHPPAGH